MRRFVQILPLIFEHSTFLGQTFLLTSPSCQPREKSIMTHLPARIMPKIGVTPRVEGASGRQAGWSGHDLRVRSCPISPRLNTRSYLGYREAFQPHGIGY